MKNWKSFLYENYVKTGQSGASKTDVQRNLESAKPYSQLLISRYLSTDKTTRIVDLGCGTGTFLWHAKESGYSNLAGIEVSEQQIEIARLAGIDFIFQGQIEPGLAQFDDQSVDVFLLKDVLEHLTREEIFSLFQLLGQKLRPAGRVIIHVPNAAGIFGSKIRYADLTHEMAFTSQSLRQLFRAFDYQKIIVREDKPVVHGLKSMVRFILWEMLTFPFRLLHLAESGTFKTELSQNITAVADR